MARLYKKKNGPFIVLNTKSTLNNYLLKKFYLFTAILPPTDSIFGVKYS